ncbi:unnamed protein product [Schistocephalus solidus]|uniref:Uncharacterized protein n=1 Tax=Schistocephalus solidus TaxID=70667 RepID=A0A183SDB7_SCHSO|nr:unnamed protein product [Schistocephalus solidus]
MMSESVQDSALAISCSSSGIDLRSHTTSLASRSSSLVNDEASADSHDTRDRENPLGKTLQGDSASSDDKSPSIFLERSTESSISSKLRQHKQQTRVLMDRRKDLLRDIAQEYSNLLRLMNEERILTGVDPEGYSDFVRAYEEAMDQFEIIGMNNVRHSSPIKTKDTVKEQSRKRAPRKTAPTRLISCWDSGQPWLSELASACGPATKFAQMVVTQRPQWQCDTA